MTTVNNNTLHTEIYLIIPIEYIPLYKKILTCFSELGENIIKNCDFTCNCSKGKIIMECWIMFQSALAARNLGEVKKEKLFIKYIEARLNTVCDCDTEDVDCVYTIIPIDKSGILKAQINCDHVEIPNFYIDVNTGKLYSEDSGSENVIDFELKDDKLNIVK